MHTETATSEITTPASGEEAVRRARELFGLFRGEARRMDEERHVPAALVEAFTDAGLVRTLVPRRWGGAELPITTALEVCIEVGKASGSMGWVAALLMDHALFMARFGEQAQEDVWGASGPDVRIATAFAPVGEVTPADGGWTISGTWSWASAVAHTDWVMIGGVVPLADGEKDYRLMLLPTAELEIIDTWYSAGLRGTGSDSIRAQDAFVPEHRTLSMADVREGHPPGAAVNPVPMYRQPLRVHGGWAFVAPTIGMARGVMEAWVEQSQRKLHTHTREQLAAALPMQLALGETSALIDCAEMLVRRCVGQSESSAEQASLEDRVRNRRDITYAAGMLMRAVNDLVQVAGASALNDDSPIQRGWRDVRAASCHVMLNFNAAAENYGRMAFGLPLNPRDPFF